MHRSLTGRNACAKILNVSPGYAVWRHVLPDKASRQHLRSTSESNGPLVDVGPSTCRSTALPFSCVDSLATSPQPPQPSSLSSSFCRAVTGTGSASDAPLADTPCCRSGSSSSGRSASLHAVVMPPCKGQSCVAVNSRTEVDMHNLREQWRPTHSLGAGRQQRLMPGGHRYAA